MDLGRLAAVLLVLLLAGCQSLPVETDEKPGIARVFERYRNAEQLERASETFTGHPDEGSDVTLRSDPKGRAGYEFDVVLDRSLDLPEGAAFRLEIVLKEGQPTLVRNFPITRRTGWFFGEYQLRLTGADNPGPGAHPVAWRLSVVGPDGAVLAARRSFLWGAPNDAPAPAR